MAINKNHEFEELNGIKCAIVERNASPERTEFLKNLLDLNRYTVVVVASPPPKVPAPPAIATTEPATPPEATALPAAPPSFTVGVTDLSFNPVNAIFGRLLKTKDGSIVTLAYWKQEENIPGEAPYFEKKH